MQDKNQIAEQQKSFIEKTVNAVKTFISSLDKTHIQTVLLAGSTARGDFFPGEYGGMVDLIVMRRKNSRATAEDIFGANQEPFIPYHCIKIAEGAAKKDDLWLEIDFRDAVTLENFEKLEEPRKFSILEGKILYDDGDAYKSELAKILELQKTETARLFDGAMGYINYLLGDYKTDRWYRRGIRSAARKPEYRNSRRRKMPLLYKPQLPACRRPVFLLFVYAAKPARQLRKTDDRACKTAD